MWSRARWVLAAGTLLAACFSPNYESGKTACSPAGECPSGFECVSGLCYQNGEGPDLSVDMSVEDDGGADLRGPDLAGVDLTGFVRHRGETCTPSDTCDTGNCVDGYCCDSSCTSACKACNLTGQEGTCSSVALGGSPVGSRNCTAQAASSCGRDGKCDGAGVCRNWPSGTTCVAGTCNLGSGDFTDPSSCNGSGSCITGSSGNCAPYKCQDATRCFSGCTDTTQCSGANTCTMMSCGKLPNGRQCAAGNGALYVSGNCVDGYCCDGGCAGGCQACDVPGSLGLCTTVSAGLPHGARTCTNQGTSPCGGSCNGSVSMCNYPGTGVACGSACSSSTQVQKSFCNSAGGCTAMPASTCSASLACVGTDCLAMCVNDPGDCAPGYGCPPGGVCKKICVYDQDNYDSGCIYGP